MSGIVGWAGNIGEPAGILLERMSESIHYAAGDRVDKWYDEFVALSRVHHALINPEAQPIFNEDNSLCIVMSGEVFGYEQQKQELIQAGHEFKFADNNAEYCLHLYEEKREDAFKELNGSFCVAIYDLVNRELLLVADRFSSRPLFYCLTDEQTLLFGTQLCSILQSSQVPRILNMAAIFEFFTLERILGTKTFYQDVHLLPPATVLRYRGGDLTLAQYWQMKYRAEEHPEGCYVNELASAIRRSVKRRTQGDYRFGLLLSGGLDSRMILAASEGEMVCFTFGDFENREVRIARRIAHAKGCKHVFLKRDRDHYANLVDRAVDVGGGMHGFIHAHGIGFFDQIRQECDVLMDGYAIERFFRGTNLPHKSLSFLGRSLYTGLDQLANENLPYEIINKLKFSMKQHNPQQLFARSCSAAFRSTLLDSVNAILEEADRNCRNIYDQFGWFDTYYISRSVAFVFETSIRSFMDERSVVFDNNLLDLHLKMPLGFRSSSKIWLKALARLDPRIAEIPDANTGYSPSTPEYLAWGLDACRKMTNTLHLSRSRPLPHPTFTQRSWPNWAELTRHNEKLKRSTSDILHDPECLDPRIFNIQRAKAMFKEYLNGKDDYTALLFLLLTFGKWHKKYGPGNRENGGGSQHPREIS
jgi:asparagine synthase (glutamine-hydrolysing)